MKTQPARLTEATSQLLCLTVLAMGILLIRLADEIAADERPAASRDRSNASAVPNRLPEWQLVVRLSAGTVHERRSGGWYEVHLANTGKLEIRKVRGGPLSRYDVLFSGALSDEERASVFRSVRDEINGFSLGTVHQPFFDGWAVTFSLRSGQRKVEVSVEDLDNPKDAGAAASLIVEMINSRVPPEHRISILDEPK